jgi:hypothetical protein
MPFSNGSGNGQDITGIKMYLRMSMYTGGGGVTYGGTAYAATEAGIKALATAVFAEASSEVVIIQSGFEGGYSTGQIKCSKGDMLRVIMELIEEFGYGPASTRQLMTFADWSGGNATT